MDSPRIYRNTAILTVLRFLDPLIAVAVTVAISRHLGPAIFGAYAVLVATVRVTVVIGQLGIGTLLVREVAKRPEHATSYLNTALIIAAMSSACVTVGVMAVGPSLRLPPEASSLLLLASVSIFPSVVVSCYESVFTGFEKMELVLLRSLASGAVRAALMVAVVFLTGKLIHLVLVELVTTAFSVVLCAGVFRRNRPPQVALPLKPELRRFAVGALPFFGTSVVTVLASRTDVFILTRYRSVTEVALYVAAYKFFELAMVLPQAYIRSSFPQLSMHAGRDPSKLMQFSQRLLRDMQLYVTATAATLIGFGALILYVVYGKKFSDAIYALQVLGIALVPWGLGRIFANALVASDHQRFDFVSGLVATSTNVTLLFFLVPRYGIVGAAFAALSSLIVGCVLQMIFARVMLGAGTLGGNSKWFAAATIACGCIVLLSQPGSLARACISGLLLIPALVTVARELPRYLQTRTRLKTAGAFAALERKAELETSAAGRAE
jgi:O-antigen/teichoic acid export membrane protein